MGKVIPMSWLNQILLISSISCVLLSLVIEKWAGLTSLPIYVSISWAIFVLIASVWLSCYLFQLALKANRPLDIKFLNDWLRRKLATDLKLRDAENETERNDKNENEVRANSVAQKRKSFGSKRISAKHKRARDIFNLTLEIDAKCIHVWYKSISEDREFPNEARELLKKLLTKLFHRIGAIDKVKLTHKLSDVFLLHLKEYHRALRRVEKGTAPNLEEAFKYLHPGSRNPSALEHMLHRTVTILAQEFLQWELTSSLPCKLLLSVLAKRLLIFIDTVSSPNWLFQSLSDLLEPIPDKVQIEGRKKAESDSQKIVSNALEDGMTSATAAVIPRPLPKAKSEPSDGSSARNEDTSLLPNDRRPSLRLDNLATEHRGLWGQSLVEIDGEEDKISPVYEEPTDFATTIARLRTVLQQKSTVNTPLQVEEKSCVVYEGSQFTNLSIPWTEFHTALDGSQQLLYCIQFDDVEQRGVDLFETTIATVRRQYRDFAQLHASLQEIPELASVMSNLVLPEGGRLELENYLKTLTTRLANESPPQLRHFLRPSSNANKKADVVAPRFDKFLVKTVSGVFNTLRTVVPRFEAEEEEIVPLPTLMPLADIPWRFVEDTKSKSLAAGLKQLIAERTEYSCVDSAYEAVDSMDGSNDFALLNQWLEVVKTGDEEDVDELDSHLRLTSVTVDIVCELLAGIGSNNTTQQEAVVRWLKLVFGNVTESMLQTAVLRIFDRLADASFYKIREELSEEPFLSVKERLLREIFGNVSSDVKMVFGDEDTASMLRYLLDSYEIKKLNIDLNLRILDVLASQLLISCRS